MRLYLPGGLLKRGDACLSDLTTATQTAASYWDPDAVDVLVIPFDVEPTEAEQSAIRHRLVTTDSDDETRYADLLNMRAQASTPFERMWLDTELARYGEPTT